MWENTKQNPHGRIVLPWGFLYDVPPWRRHIMTSLLVHDFIAGFVR